MENDIEQNIQQIGQPNQANMITIDGHKVKTASQIFSFKMIYVSILTCAYAVMPPKEKDFTVSKFFLAYICFMYINTYKSFCRFTRDKQVVNTPISKYFYEQLMFYNHQPYKIFKYTFIGELITGLYLFSQMYGGCGVYSNNSFECRIITFASVMTTVYYILYVIGCFLKLLCTTDRCNNCSNSCSSYSDKCLQVICGRYYQLSSLTEDDFFTSHESNEENECIICLEGEKIGDVWRILGCKHQYHSKCVDPWIRANNTCPTCRTPVI